MPFPAKKFSVALIFALPFVFPIFVRAAAYSDYSNVTDKTVTAITGCVKNEDCSGDTPCCNLQTGQCVENYGRCGVAEPKSASKPFSIVAGQIGACLVDIQPATGPWGTSATLSGNAFGNSKNGSDVTFNGEVGRIGADYSGIDFQWSDVSISDIKVPVDSISGEVRVMKGGVESNGLNFSVTGGEGTFCGQDLNNPVCQPDDSLCSHPLVCDLSSCRCQKILGTGEPCDADEEKPACQPSQAICQALDSRLACDTEKNCTCQPLPGIGESCDADQAADSCQADNGICQQYSPLLTCDVQGAVGQACTCQIVKGPGEPCGEGENACADDCSRFGNPSLACDIEGAKGDLCTCQAINGLGEPCSEGENACAEDNCVRFEEPALFCDLEGVFSADQKPCTCQLDPNIGAPCYAGAAADQCQVELSVCEQKNTKYRQYFCDDQGIADPDALCTCQLNEPRIIKTYPAPDEANVCRNAMPSITFSGILDKKTIDANTIFLLNDNKAVTAKLSAYDEDSNADGTPDRTVVMVAPAKNMDSGASYQAVVKGGKNGIKDAGGTLRSHDYEWNFTVGSSICKIDHLDIVIAPPGLAGTKDWFTCARNNCENDQDATLNGNQHVYSAQARDVVGIPLVASYRWSKDDADGIISDLPPIADSQKLTVQNKNGQAAVNVQADGAEAGVVIGKVAVNVFLCENPWPPIGKFPYQDTADSPQPTGANPTNFSTYYCRDSQSPSQ